MQLIQFIGRYFNNSCRAGFSFIRKVKHAIHIHGNSFSFCKNSGISTYASDGVKTEENRFDGTGKLLERETYTYNANGDRTIELTFNIKGELIKKAFILYDKKGLKTEKKTMDPKDKLLEVKKYTYEF